MNGTQQQKKKWLLLSEGKILMQHLYLQRITDYFRVKIAALASIVTIMWP